MRPAAAPMSPASRCDVSTAASHVRQLAQRGGGYVAGELVQLLDSKTGVHERVGERPAFGHRVIVEPLADRLFRPAPLERREPLHARFGWPAREELARARQGAGERALDEEQPGELGQSRELFGERVRGATHGCRGVVQLVRETRGELTERHHLLPLLNDAGRLPDPIGHHRYQSWAQNRCHAQHLIEMRLVQSPQTHPVDGTARCRERPHAGKRQPSRHHAGALRERWHQLPAHHEDDLDGSLEDGHHVLGRLIDLEHRGARIEFSHLAVRGEPLELIGAEVLEYGNGAKLFDRDAAHRTTFLAGRSG